MLNATKRMETFNFRVRTAYAFLTFSFMQFATQFVTDAVRSTGQGHEVRV